MIGIVTFADLRYKKCLVRFYKQAYNIGVFNFISINSENDLPSDYRNTNRHILTPNCRGYGFWCWKPFVVLQELESNPSLKMLFYCDAGSHIRIEGRTRLHEYIEIFSASPYNILAFQLTLVTPYILNAFDGWHPNTTCFFPSDMFKEAYWTKGDMFDYFNIDEMHPISQSPQIEGGLFAVKNTPEVRKFLRKWIEDTENYPHLFNDTPSIKPNIQGFIEHRHDQSYFSISSKYNGCKLLSAYETWCPSPDGLEVDWDRIKHTPFHHRRDKLKNRLWRVSYTWRRIFHLGYGLK